MALVLHLFEPTQLENLKRRDHLGNLGMDGRRVFKWMLDKV
jgi:hypothetical protein